MRRWEEEEKQKRKGGKKQTSEAEYWNLERRLSIAFVYGQGEKTEDATNDIASSQPRYEIPARSRVSWSYSLPVNGDQESLIQEESFLSGFLTRNTGWLKAQIQYRSDPGDWLPKRIRND
ncbi:Os04g0463050 [Oryza sativa Japonica Group]|uniref:Os04g0463050 protein n=1 Tax=Oryza sativa subsp. japonica TaxID=39947 RepID=A0A0P0WBF5_ORYSJ|nr:Os04g0463050 [Oryza sativa Japonica Group]